MSKKSADHQSTTPQKLQHGKKALDQHAHPEEVKQDADERQNDLHEKTPSKKEAQNSEGQSGNE